MAISGTNFFTALVLLSFLFIHCAQAGFNASNRYVKEKDYNVCMECNHLEGVCGNTCYGKFCMKATELQSNSIRRYCMSILEPGLPEPGHCKVFDGVLNQSEMICACVGDYCNGVSFVSPSILTMIVGCIFLWFH